MLQVNNGKENIKKEKIIEGLKQVEDIVLMSGDIKNSDCTYLDDLYYFLEGKLKDFFLDSSNNTRADDMLKYRQGKWLVELIFAEGGLRVYCSRSRQGLNNQPPWSEDSYYDFATDELKELLNVLESIKSRARG